MSILFYELISVFLPLFLGFMVVYTLFYLEYKFEVISKVLTLIVNLKSERRDKHAKR